MLYALTLTLSVDAAHERLIWLEDATVAVKLDGAVGGVVSPVEPDPEARNATICIIHGADGLNVAAAL